MERNIKTLLENLIIKTNTDEALWERAGKNNLYSLTLLTGTIRISALAEGGYAFTIDNSKAERIYTIESQKDAPLPEDYEILKGFYTTVKHKYLKVDETIKGLISESGKKGNVGMINNDDPLC